MTKQEFTPWPQGFRERYVAEGLWTNVPLTGILASHAGRTPDQPALIDHEQQLTWRQLDQSSNRLAHWLLNRGVRPGDKALIQLPNGASFYIMFWALLKLNVRPVCALFSHNAHELTSFCRQLKPALIAVSRRHKLFADENFLRSSLAPLAGAGTVFVDDADGLNIKNFLDDEICDVSTPPQIDVRAEEVAFFQLSGGSTNIPKLIPRTHADYYYSLRRSAEICALSSRSVYLCALPAPHNFPMSSPGALGAWHAGGCVVVATDPSPQSCFPLIERHLVTITALVPPMLNLWLDAARTGKHRISSLEVLQVGGARLPESLAARIEPELGCRLQQVFGMAEGLVCYTRLDDDDWHRFNTQGRPMSDADEIRITDENGVQVADGEVGLLLTRGPYTVRGYYCAEEHNKQVFTDDGFYVTGDLVRRTPSGHLIVSGREKDQINRGGEKIAAAEVENLLLTYEGVIQAAVVAMPDAVLGEKSCAWLVCEGELPKFHLLRRHLRTAGIADFKLPDHFIKIDVLPLTPVGKPDKALLRKMLGQENETQVNQ